MEWIRKLRQFLADVTGELKKTTWPGRREVYGTTVVVIATVFICAVYLYFVDQLVYRSMQFIFRAFGR